VIMTEIVPPYFYKESGCGPVMNRTVIFVTKAYTSRSLENESRQDFSSEIEGVRIGAVIDALLQAVNPSFCHGLGQVRRRYVHMNRYVI